MRVDVSTAILPHMLARKDEPRIVEEPARAIVVDITLRTAVGCCRTGHGCPIRVRLPCGVERDAYADGAAQCFSHEPSPCQNLVQVASHFSRARKRKRRPAPCWRAQAPGGGFGEGSVSSKEGREVLDPFYVFFVVYNDYYLKGVHL